MKQAIVWLIIFLGLLSGLQYYRVTAKLEADKAENYQQNNKLLLNKIRRVYAEKIILQQENKKLEEAAKMDNNNFDWDADISHSSVIKCLQAN